MSELISIITPLYNAEKYIKDTIESVINQDYENWEMLIVDDCSKDRSKLIVEKYMELDKRIKLISLENNMGVAFARNIGIKSASGEYLAFLDSDDLWKPNKLSVQLDFMKQNNYAFTFTGYEMINDEGIKLNKIIKAPAKLNYRKLLYGNQIGCLTVMLNKKKIGDIEMPAIRHEDYATWLNIVKGGITAYGLNENLALYRKANSSVSSNKLKSAIWTWDIYRKYQRLSSLNSLKCFIMYVYFNMLKHRGL
jgi:teichuronic acid biosynthesis glycosyltransferase TuaG